MLLKGWHCWKNNEYLFQHPNFIFLEEEFSFGDETVFHIFIVNKKTLSASLHKNIECFKALLGPDFSPQNFILSIEKAGVLRPLINNDEALLGLILGYGTESPTAYKKQNAQIDKKDDWSLPKRTENYTGLEALCPKKCRIHPVAFVGDPKSKEVVSLLNLYTQELEEIWKVSKASKDPLKLILEKLCAE